MLSKNTIKFVNSLALKKNRDAEQLFVAEGEKLVTDFLENLPCEMVVATEKFLEKQDVSRVKTVVAVATADELKKISCLKTPPAVVAIFRQLPTHFSVEICKKNLVLALDDVQDPGNLGTIVRIADWFGIKNVVCSSHTADIYNPKTVQATMGALCRVQVHYVDLEPIFASCSEQKIPIYGTFLNGETIYSASLNNCGLLVMGNEGNGISERLQPFISHRLFIPNFPLGAATSESLNVAVATAIACSEFRRRNF